MRVKTHDEWTEVIHHEEVGHWDSSVTTTGVWIVDTPAWDQTIDHAATYTTITVSGEAPADLANPDPEILDNIREALQAEEAKELAAATTEEEIATIQARYANLEQTAINNQLVTESEANSSVGGDPVRFATGEFVIPKEHDLTWNYGALGIDLSRSYLSSSISSHSLGKGWIFSYDMRIIIGVNPDAQTMYEEIKAKYEAVDDLCKIKKTVTVHGV